MGRNDFPLTVIADDRERKSEVVQFLSEMKNVSVGIKRLSFGDYVVDNRLVFERKTLKDFLHYPSLTGDSSDRLSGWQVQNIRVC